MTIMKSMGVNAFRTSHNPPSPQIVQVCEELGIVMMVEAFDMLADLARRPTTTAASSTSGREGTSTEMVLAARNSPAVVLWSIGNEIPDSTSTAGLAMADRIIGAIRAADDTRPLVIGSDQIPPPPHEGSAADLMLAKLDGLGLNYNPAKSVDALHAAYPTTVPLRVRVVVRDLHRAPPTRSRNTSTPGRTTPRAGGRSLLRQQPRLLDDERRVRSQEGPRP